MKTPVAVSELIAKVVGRIHSGTKFTAADIQLLEPRLTVRQINCVLSFWSRRNRIRRAQTGYYWGGRTVITRIPKGHLLQAVWKQIPRSKSKALLSAHIASRTRTNRPKNANFTRGVQSILFRLWWQHGAVDRFVDEHSRHYRYYRVRYRSPSSTY